jgi:transposase
MPIRPYDNKNQLFLLPPSVNEWVRADHPARVLSDIVDHLDVSGFRTVSTEGRPCYDPRLMVKVLLWGYATGVRASRKIEERLHSDVVFMWLAGLQKPDFRTICLFRKDNQPAIEAGTGGFGWHQATGQCRYRELQEGVGMAEGTGQGKGGSPPDAG